MEITQKTIPHIFRNKYLKNTSSGGFISTSNSSSQKSGLPYTIDEEGNYIVDGAITFKGNVLSTGEVAAYAENSTKYEGTYSPLKHAHSIADINSLQSILDTLSEAANTKISIIDNLESSATDSALSSNQGRILKGLIDSKSNVTSWNELIDKPSNFPPSTHTHDDNYYSKGEVDNKIELKKTGLPYTIDEEGNYIVDGAITFKGNVLSTGEVAAYAENSTKYEGTYSPLKHVHNIAEINSLQSILDTLSGGTSTNISIIDNLESSATDSALSSNQGRILKGLIDSKSNISSWNDITDKPSTFTPSAHNHTVTEITNLSNLLDGKAATSHNHEYTNTVKIGATAYNVASNVISLPTYPTTLPASDVYAWAKAGTKPSYSWSEIDSKPSNFPPSTHAHDDRYYSKGEVNNQLSTKSNNGHGHNVNEISDSMPHSFFHWSGQGGQPTWLWGGNNFNDYYVYNPSNFSVNYANSADNSNMVDGLHGSQFMRSDTSTTCNGNILATGEITAYSDIRLKSNIEKLTNRGKLNPITYTKGGKKSIGFIAQEVQYIYPELVIEEETENKYLSLNYNQITAVLAVQINELSEEVNDLKKQINELKNKK